MARIKIYREDYIPTPTERLWNNFRDNHFSLAGLWIIGILVLVSIIGPLLVPYGGQEQIHSSLLLQPAWTETGQTNHLLGTDDLGRDIFSRLVLGSTITFGLAISIVLLSLCLGGIIGCFAGVYQRFQLNILNHFIDTLLSIPSLLMAILFVALIGPGVQTLFIAITLSTTPQFIRVIQHTVTEEIQKEYVVAAKLDGANLWQILWYAIMPNVWDKLILQISLCLSTAILDIAALGFLGLGVQSPSPEWGVMVAQSTDNLLIAPWTVIAPGLAIFFTVLSINLVGNGLRNALQAKK